jgi:amino acid permease
MHLHSDLPQNSGLVVGLVLLLVMGLCMLFTLHELAVCAEIAGASSYEKLGFVSEFHFWGFMHPADSPLITGFQRRGSVVVQASIILLNFGTLVSYIVIVKDLSMPVLQSVLSPGNILLNCAFFMALVTLLLMLPLSLLEHVRWLAYTSFVAVALYAMFVIVVVVRFGTMDGSSLAAPLAFVNLSPYAVIIARRFNNC